MKLAPQIRNLLLVITLVTLTGCASTPMASKEQDAASKTFKEPSPGMSGIYIYRNGGVGGALKKRVSIDSVVIGETAPNTFFHKEVAPGEHTLSTQSEFGDNELKYFAAAGKNNYFHQYIKMGVFVGGANIEAVSETEGQKGVLQCMEAYSPEMKQNNPVNNPVPTESNTSVDTISNSNAQKLRDLQALRKDGVITEDEFQKKKQQLLEKL